MRRLGPLTPPRCSIGSSHVIAGAPRHHDGPASGNPLGLARVSQQEYINPWGLGYLLGNLPPDRPVGSLNTYLAATIPDLRYDVLILPGLRLQRHRPPVQRAYQLEARIVQHDGATFHSTLC